MSKSIKLTRAQRRALERLKDGGGLSGTRQTTIHALLMLGYIKVGMRFCRWTYLLTDAGYKVLEQ